MKFYVNLFYNNDQSSITEPPSDKSTVNDLIGLFTQCSTIGEGSFCGYYTSESYIDTNLLAFYISSRKVGCAIEFKNRSSEVGICNPPLELSKIQIGSHIWTKVIEAETSDEAIEKFSNGEWRQWDYSKDEISKT